MERAMEDAFNNLANLLAEDVSEEYKAEIEQLTEQIAAIDVAPQAAAPVPPLPPPMFDPERNLLEPGPMRRFIANDFTPTIHFTEVISTTNTMEGYLSNVQFHEQELITRVRGTPDVVDYHCNYGRVTYPGYVPPVRVRKKKVGAPRRRPRKIQGSGTDFNSQLTAVVRSRTAVIGPGSCVFADDPNVLVDGIIHIPTSASVYKFKVFRTGRIQLPGAKPDTIEDVMECIQILVRELNAILYPDGSAPIELVYILPVMKNYKFSTRPRVIEVESGIDEWGIATAAGKRVLPLLDLDAMMAALLRYRSFVTPGRNEYGEIVPPPEPDWDDFPPPAAPHMFDIKYTREDTKLSIKFSTPIPTKPKKKTRVNIFMSGKINILGAFDDAATDQIVQYLDWVLESNSDLFVESYVPDPWTLERVDNIEPVEAREEESIIYSLNHGLPMELPAVSEEDYSLILRWLDRAGEALWPRQC